MANIISCKCLWNLLILTKWHATHDVNACETGLRLYCESVKNCCQIACEIISVWCIIYCNSRLVNCHRTLWSLHASQPHVYKIAIDCMYPSWNLYCHCSATQSPVICDMVALFIVTWPPFLLKVRVNPSLYCDNLVFHLNTWSKFCDIGGLVCSKYSMETHHNQTSHYYTLEVRINPSLHCDNRCLVFAWTSCSHMI